ncbi:glycosyltransferase family 9 protein [Costertonia aggregata]|uniref:Glycosyltransferase family 9 protein n=2 Tax=Costertonia aggregata TaxID=343403 RepID=A0A7H9AWB4_9FLAO|nr:glycosyltransferase family 9 protein [Costertonia aggregata]
MGDVAMTVPVLMALVAKYPGLKVTVLTKAFFMPIFSQIHNVTVHSVDVKKSHKGLLGLYRLYKELKPLNIQAVADLHNVLRSNILKFFFQFSKTPFLQIDKGRAEKKALTSLKNKVFEPLKTTHQRYADVFGELGFPIDFKQPCTLSREHLPKSVSGIVGDDAGLKRIGIAPFAAFKGKMYPLHLMEKVLDRLNNSEKYQIILFGGGKEEQKQLEAWEDTFSNCINIVGKLSFADELSLISNLNGMLAMDSGNAHLAAMYGVPVITLWGVTHPYAGFAPFGQSNTNMLLSNREKYPLIPTSIYGNTMPNGYEKAIETISPDSIVSKIAFLLEHT